jgi:hypothetical protein
VDLTKHIRHLGTLSKIVGALIAVFAPIWLIWSKFDPPEFTGKEIIKIIAIFGYAVFITLIYLEIIRKDSKEVAADGQTPK